MGDGQCSDQPQGRGAGGTGKWRKGEEKNGNLRDRIWAQVSMCWKKLAVAGRYGFGMGWGKGAQQVGLEEMHSIGGCRHAHGAGNTHY